MNNSESFSGFLDYARTAVDKVLLFKKTLDFIAVSSEYFLSAKVKQSLKHYSIFFWKKLDIKRSPVYSIEDEFGTLDKMLESCMTEARDEPPCKVMILLLDKETESAMNKAIKRTNTTIKKELKDYKLLQLEHKSRIHIYYEAQSE